MPELFVKDIIRAGKWWMPRLQAWLNVTAERMDNWAKTCKLMLERGVAVDVTTDHVEGATAKRGQIVDLYRDGDKLMMKCRFADEESIKLAQRCPEVSLELERNVEDGHGNHYDEAITAVTITRQPVIPGQEPFRKIAASRGRGEVLYLSTADSKDIKDQADPPNTKKGATMEISEKDIRDLARILNVDDSGTPAEIFKRIMDEARELDGADKGEGEKTEGLELGPNSGSPAAKAMWAQVTDAGGKTAKGGYKGMKGKWVKMGLSLKALIGLRSEKDQEISAAKIELSRSGAPTVDPDALEMAAEAKGTKIDALAEKGKITPACRDLLKGLLIGKAGAGKSLFLSRKAATHAGLPEPIADGIISALESNDPIELAKLQGEKTKSQKVLLNRQVPGGKSELNDDDKRAQDEMLKMAKER
jgi:hypothetical protein